MSRAGVTLITLAQVLSPRAKAVVFETVPFDKQNMQGTYPHIHLSAHCGFPQTTESETSKLQQQLWLNEETSRNYKAILSIHGLQVTQHGSADCPPNTIYPLKSMPSLHDSIAHKVSSAEVAAG